MTVAETPRTEGVAPALMASKPASRRLVDAFRIADQVGKHDSASVGARTASATAPSRVTDGVG